MHWWQTPTRIVRSCWTKVDRPQQNVQSYNNNNTLRVTMDNQSWVISKHNIRLIQPIIRTHTNFLHLLGEVRIWNISCYSTNRYMETVKIIPIKMLTLSKKTDNKAEKQEIQLRPCSLCHIKLLCKMSCEGFYVRKELGCWLLQRCLVGYPLEFSMYLTT